VKYRADLRRNWARLRPAFIRAREWAREHNAAFRIATERNIRGPTLDNAKRLLSLRQAPVDSGVRDLILTAVRSMGSPSFGGVLASVPLSRQATLGAVWRLVAQGTLRVDLSAPITFDTRMTAL
jgi:hypothetical protein